MNQGNAQMLPDTIQSYGGLIKMADQEDVEPTYPQEHIRNTLTSRAILTEN